MYDAVIIGAGVSGCAIARELSKYEGNFCVLEKGEDLCCGTSKANSGIVHSGHDAKYGTLKAKLNVRGNAMMGKLSEDLDIPFIRNGSLVVGTQEDMPKLHELYENGLKNNVPGLRLLSKEEVREKEPHIAAQIECALYAPTGGIICPFELTIALGENAYANGAEFVFQAEVTGIEPAAGGYRVQAGGCSYETKTVINAAGVYADEIHNLICERKLSIIPRRGEYMLLDKSAGSHVSCTIFEAPGKYGKGVLVTPTVHGNLLVGPTALDIEDKKGTNTTAKGLQDIKQKSCRTVEDVPFDQVITSFAGLRAHETSQDFIIEETKQGFFDCAGIASPGLSSSPAIGEMAAEMVRDYLKLSPKDYFIEKRKGILHPGVLTEAERNALIKKEPAYGTIVCRCEMVTEGEILDAIRRPLGARSMDGVKRRTRAGMGRCQSGFCAPKVMEILAREQKIEMTQVTKAGENSMMLTGRVKEAW